MISSKNRRAKPAVGTSLIRQAIAAATAVLAAPASAQRVAIRPGASAASDPGEVAFTWLGVTHWLMETPVGGALLDAYLSRPPFPANGTTEEGLGALRSLLATARPGRIRWIFIGHSHSDHAVDAGAFAAETGAIVVGSATTCFVAQAGGLDPRRCRIVDDGDTLRFGRLEVVVLRTPHTAPSTPGLGRYEVLTAPPPRASGGPNGGALSFLFRLRASRGPARLSWLYTNSIAAIDSDDGSGIGFRAGVQALFASVPSPDLWLAAPFLTGPEMGDYLDLIRPRAVLPQHWDGTAPILTDGLAVPFRPPQELAGAFAERGIPLVEQRQYGDRFVLDRSGVTRVENDRVRLALGIPLDPVDLGE